MSPASNFVIFVVLELLLSCPYLRTLPGQEDVAPWPHAFLPEQYNVSAAQGPQLS